MKGGKCQADFDTKGGVFKNMNNQIRYLYLRRNSHPTKNRLGYRLLAFSLIKYTLCHRDGISHLEEDFLCQTL